jgi:predicted nucleotidyltransferase
MTRAIQRLSAPAAREALERSAKHLATDARLQLVFLFGSTLDPGQRAVRDVDLAVLTEPPLSLDELVRLRADAVLAAGAPTDERCVEDIIVQLGAHRVIDQSWQSRLKGSGGFRNSRLFSSDSVISIHAWRSSSSETLNGTSKCGCSGRRIGTDAVWKKRCATFCAAP